MASTPEEQWHVLLRIIPSSGSRPKYRDGQYIPTHAVDEIRRQGLDTLFSPYSPIKIEACLNPQTGRQYRNLYMATFPDFDAVHGARGAWDAVELADNPYIAMVIMEDVSQDEKIAKLRQDIGRDEEAACKAVTLMDTPQKLRNVFHDWWAAVDPHHWVEHKKRVQHEDEVHGKGVWLYKNDPDDPHYYTDPTTYSYTPPAVVEYSIHGRKDEQNESVEWIDWNATQKLGRLVTHIPQAKVSKFMFAVKAINTEPSPTSSDSEDGGPNSDSPDTTPPSSPLLEEANISRGKHGSLNNKNFNKNHQPNDETSAIIIVMAAPAVVIRNEKESHTEDPMTKFKQALAKSGIKLSAPTDTNDSPDTPTLPTYKKMVDLQNPAVETVVSPPKHMEAFPLNADASPFVLPTNAFYLAEPTPGSPIDDISYQYPHFFIHRAPDNESQYADPDHLQDRILGHGDLFKPQEVDLRVYCWQKYGLDIEAIRMNGFAALQPEFEKAQDGEEVVMFDGDPLDVWKTLEEAVRVEKAKEIATPTLVAAADQPEEPHHQGYHSEKIDNQIEENPNLHNTGEDEHTPGVAPGLVTEEAQYYDNAHEESTRLRDCTNMETSTMNFVSQKEDGHFIDPEEAWYAQLLADTSIEVEIIDGTSSPSNCVPAMEETSAAVNPPDATTSSVSGDVLIHDGFTGEKHRTALEKITDTKLVVDTLGTEGQIVDSQCHTQWLTGPGIRAQFLAITEEERAEYTVPAFWNKPEGIEDLSDHIPSPVPALEIVGETGVPTMHFTEHVWLKIALLLILDYYSLGMFSRLIAHPLVFLLVMVFTLSINQDAEYGLVGQFWRSMEECTLNAQPLHEDLVGTAEPAWIEDASAEKRLGSDLVIDGA